MTLHCLYKSGVYIAFRTGPIPKKIILAHGSHSVFIMKILNDVQRFETSRKGNLSQPFRVQLSHVLINFTDSFTLNN